MMKEKKRKKKKITAAVKEKMKTYTIRKTMSFRSP